MRVFVTGGSGHIGSAVIPELQAAGHQVLALARSDASAAKLAAAGAEVCRGDLGDLDVIRKAAADADGVIHLAYRRDLMHSGDAAGVVAANLNVIEAAGEALEGTGKPFVAAAGTLVLWAGGITSRPESAPAGSRLHGVAEEGVPFREFAEAIGRNLGVPAVSIAPQDAAGHFGFLGAFAAADNPTSSALTRRRLGWEPAHPGLIADLDDGHYFKQ